MDGQTVDPRLVLVQNEGGQTISLPSLPSFSELAHQFWGNLPEHSVGQVSPNFGPGPHTPHVPKIRW